MKVVTAIIFMAIAATGCSKKDSNCPSVNITAPTSETLSVKAYLDANNISATADTRGFYYTIQSAGTANKPTACQDVDVDYEGK